MEEMVKIKDNQEPVQKDLGFGALLLLLAFLGSGSLFALVILRSMLS
jgi:hypothetical protein